MTSLIFVLAGLFCSICLFGLSVFVGQVPCSKKLRQVTLFYLAVIWVALMVGSVLVGERFGVGGEFKIAIFWVIFASTFFGEIFVKLGWVHSEDGDIKFS